MKDAEREAAFMKRSYAEHLKFARRQAIVFTILAIVMMISLVYIFFQREAMFRQDAQFVKLTEQLNLYKKRAEEAEQKVVIQDLKLEESLKAASDAMEDSKQSNKRK